jgi:hypothetical protein
MRPLRAEISASGSSVVGPSQIGSSLLWWPLLAISLAAFAVEVPFFFLGTPSGHDVEFHLYSWLEVLGQWRLGIIFPRWASLANFGCGEPRFLFYPPASWSLGAAISTIFPWTLAASIYIWIALVAAGASMFLLMRRWIGRRDAIFAAVFYAANPYHLVIVYWRSAFAELLASCLLPLLLLLVLKAADGERRVMLPLSLVMAGAWLTNAPAALMVHYSLALMILFFAWRTRSPRILAVGAGAVALGACLAAFYLLPAVYEQRWVNIAGAIGGGLRPLDGFLFTRTSDVDHDNFNHVVSWVAVSEMLVVLIAAAAAKRLQTMDRRRWSGLALWSAACAALMFPVTNVLWRVLPKLQFMQFPWRWLLCLSLCCSLFVAMGISRWWQRVAVYFAMLAVLLIAGWRFQPPWWDHAADMREMQDNMATGAGYEGVDEYTPVGADPSALTQDDTGKVRIARAVPGVVHVESWKPESKVFTAEMSGQDQLAVRLFPYPAWEVEVNGHVVETTVGGAAGQMLVPVTAGVNRVKITFLRTWDRTAGGWISLITALCLALWVMPVWRRASPVQA